MVHAVNVAIVDPRQWDCFDCFLVHVVIARKGAVFITIGVVSDLIFTVRAIRISVVDDINRDCIFIVVGVSTAVELE